MRRKALLDDDHEMIGSLQSFCKAGMMSRRKQIGQTSDDLKLLIFVAVLLGVELLNGIEGPFPRLMCGRKAWKSFLSSFCRGPMRTGLSNGWPPSSRRGSSGAGGGPRPCEGAQPLSHSARDMEAVCMGRPCTPAKLRRQDLEV